MYVILQCTGHKV